MTTTASEAKRMTEADEADLRDYSAWCLRRSAHETREHGRVLSAALAELDDLRAKTAISAHEYDRRALGRAITDSLEREFRPADTRDAANDRETIERLTAEGMEAREHLSASIAEASKLARENAELRKGFSDRCRYREARLEQEVADLRKQKATVDARLHEARERIEELERSSAMSCGIEFDPTTRIATSVTYGGERFLPVQTSRCAFCEWVARSESLGERMATYTEHLKVCENHPMRAVEKERDELRAIADRATTTCEYCDWISTAPTRNERQSRAAMHVLVCAKHPMRKVEKQREELLAAIKPVAPLDKTMAEFEKLGGHVSVSFQVTLGNVRAIKTAVEACK